MKFIIWLLLPFALWLCPKDYPRSQVIFPNQKKQQRNVTSSDYWSFGRVSNENFLKSYSFPYHRINNTDVLNNAKEVIACVPDMWGYSEYDGLQAFPPFEYPDCKDLTDVKGNILLDTENNLLVLNCTGDFKGRFVIGPSRNVKLYHYKDKDWNVQFYDGKPYKLKGNEEWVLGSCESYGKLELVQMRPRYQQHIDQQQNLVRQDLLKYTKKKVEPLTILHITLDSFSRRHFYRKLNNTVEYLNQLNSENKYATIDFLMHNIKGEDSIRNQIHVFGQQYQKFPQNQWMNDTLGGDAIWNILGKQGFITLFGLESCNRKFVPALGQLPNITHTINEFYCASSVYADYTIQKKHSEQRCLGPKMSHRYVMEYALEFMNLYQQNNQWIYLHFNAAHESTGQHAQTIDKDLVWFLKKLLQKNVVIFLEGDHGMRYGNWYKAQEAYIEYRLPALFLIVSHKLLSWTQYSYSNLQYNSERLTSKGDIRATTISIAMQQAQFYHHLSRENGIDLLKYRIPDARTCDMVAISPWYCSCSQFKEVLAVEAQDYIITELNQVIYQKLYAKTSPRGLCQKFTLKEISYISELQIHLQLKLVKLIVKSEEFPEVQFEAMVFIGNQVLRSKRGNSSPNRVAYHNPWRLKISLFMINRLDRYEGACEKAAKLIGVDEKYCICRPEFLKELQ